MKYPNSVSRGGGAAARSAAPASAPRPLPRRPQGPQPRRKPGRPVPKTPRRPPAYRPSAPKVGTPPITRPPSPSRIPRIERGLKGLGKGMPPWYGPAAIFAGAASTLIALQLQSELEGVGILASCSADRRFNLTSTPGSVYCGPTKFEGVPSGPVRSIVRPVGRNISYARFEFDAWRLNADPTSEMWPDRFVFRARQDSPQVPRAGDIEALAKYATINDIPGVKFRPASKTAFPQVRPEFSTWQYALAPWLVPPTGKPSIWEAPAIKPGYVPARPPQISPEAPAVGPQPQPVPKPDPVTRPVDNSETVIKPDGSVANLPRSNAKPHRAKRGEKESKVRMGRAMSAVWNSIGGVTEAMDFGHILYEALPKHVKVAVYKKLGRQPKPHEKYIEAYRHLDKIDIPTVLNEYVKNEIEDRIWAAGGEAAKKHNQNYNRPIGIEAGGGLTGGGEYIGVSSEPPAWWPPFLPW